MTETTANHSRLYDEGAEDLLQVANNTERVNLIPGEIGGRPEPGNRIRIQWGQDMIRDILDLRYRTIICAVNDEDNANGIISQLVNLVPTSQWTVNAVTAHALGSHKTISEHGQLEREPYVLKYDLDSVTILALLRPAGRDHFTLEELGRGFQHVVRMLRARHDRHPACSVSFLGARRNRVVGPDGREPSFEAVLRTMHNAGFRGDVYPSLMMWDFVHVGVFPTYPFPEGIQRMREGSS